MPRKQSWLKKLSWRFEYTGYRFLEFILTPVPITVIDRMGSGIGFLLYYLSTNYRNLAMRNLRIAYGKRRSRREIQTLARATCQRTIANFFGALKTPLLSTETISQHVSYEGSEYLLDALSQKKGAILVLGHMGNWEILNRLHGVLPKGTPAGGIYQPLKNPLVNALILERRRQDGSRMFSKRDGFHGPAGFVKDGGLLVIVADQKVGKSGITLPFFNRLSTLSPLPALMARKAGSPVLAAGIETVTPGHWRIVFQPLGEQPKTSKITASLETLIRRSPADYLWLHNRWKLPKITPLSITGKRGTESHLQTSPHRTLLLTTKPPDVTSLQNYLESRSPQDIPLACEFLTILDTERVSLPESPFPLTQLLAPNSGEITTTLTRLHDDNSRPLETILVLEPEPELIKLAKNSQAGAVHTNSQRLPLADFLSSLSAPARIQS